MMTTAVRRHGVRATYCAGCHCTECRAANAAYQSHRLRLAAQRQWGAAPPAMVDAGPVRAHVLDLVATGMSAKRVATKAGVSTGAISKLLYGTATKRPSHMVRQVTAQRLLSVHPVPGARVDATGTRRRIQALIAVGWSASQIGARLGISPTNMWGLSRRLMVSARTAARVRALYDELWDRPPPEDTHRQRVAASRSRRRAAACGWAPPVAWDDDAIDDPKAEPHGVRRDAS
jgi:hypothetical protein